MGHHALHVSHSFPDKSDLEKLIESFFSDVEYEIFVEETLKIDLSREIIGRSQKTSNQTGQSRVIAVGFHSGTREAQNALLKVLEEPSRSTRFLIVAPKENLLDTITSRIQTMENPLSSLNEGDKEIEDLLNIPLAKRLSYVASIETKREAYKLLEKLVRLSGQEYKQLHLVKKAIEKGMRHLSLPSSSIKQILETVMVAIPQKKQI